VALDPPATPLLRRTTCPHCWETFPPEEVLWVSAHSDLHGDPRLGPDRPQRFLPTRFDLDGNALDARDARCTVLACPRCHLPIPRGLLEMEPFFVSILGATGCGKSYYLAAMTWGMRQVLPDTFALGFQDADPDANRVLTGYEQSLFLHPRGDDLVPLGDLILKTEMQGDLYDTVSYGNQAVSYPRPFLFTLTAQERHPNAARARQLARTLCLYDNAGEHFQPGMDSAAAPGTRHLAQARLLLFLFDPTQDLRFRERCGAPNGPAGGPPPVTSRQEQVLLEAAARVRRLTNLGQTEKHPRPLLVLVTKYDAWAHALEGKVLSDDPWRPTKKQVAALDTERIAYYSDQVRNLLRETCREVVYAAESFAQQVTYFPVSALGRRPILDPRTNGWAIHPRKLRPIWATVPLLYGLSKCLPGTVAGLKPSSLSQAGPGPAPAGGKATGRVSPIREAGSGEVRR
jgi:hypothetical protein